MAATTDELTRRMGHVSSQPPTVTNSDSQEAAEIQAQIEKAREQMGRTIDEIQTRLSPDNIKRQTQEAIREATVEKVEKMANQAEMKVRSWRRGAMETVKDNPIPVALIGIGLGWMLLNDNDGHDYDYYRQRPVTGGGSYRYYDRREGRYYTAEDGEDLTGRIGEAAEDVKDWASDHVDIAKEKVSNAANTVRHKRDEAVDNIRDQAEHTAEQTQEAAYRMRLEARRQQYRAKRSFSHALNENPLALGIAALAAGALVGLALPSTDLENRLVGETRDRVVEEAKAETKQAARKVQAVAEHAQHAAVEEAKREAEKQDLVKGDGLTEEEKQQQQRASTAFTR